MALRHMFGGRSRTLARGWMTMTPNRYAILILIGLAVLAYELRSCAPHPASGGPRSTVYVPYVGVRGRCDYRRDPWDCHMMTATARAAVTPTPTRASATWAPGPYEPLGRVWLPITADVTGPGRVCSAAWAPNGAWWTARHCLVPNPLLLRVDGAVVTAWQADRSGRDLAQLRAGDGGQLPVLTHPSPGEHVTLRPAHGDVGGTYYGGAWARQYADGYEIGPAQFEAARPMGVVCVGAGRIGQGDSGGGMYRDSDGALGGVVVAAEADADYDAWCGDDQRVLVELVP